MKRILLTSIAAAGLAAPSLLADYTVFRVCEDQHVIKTSDGAEAGRVEYIVVDPAQQRIVSAVLTGGVVSDRYVAVPFSTIQMGSGRDITLTTITRERLVAAPVIERTRLTSTTVIEPSYFEKSYTHFGVSGGVGATVERTRTDVDVDAAGRDRVRGDRDPNMRREGRDAAGTVTTDPASAPAGQPGSTATQPPGSDRTKAERAKTDADDAKKPAEARDAEKKAARDAAKGDTDAPDTDKKKGAVENEKEAAKSRAGSRDVKADDAKPSSPGASGSTPPKTETSAPGASGSTPAAESGTRATPGKEKETSTLPDSSPGASGSTPAAKSGVGSKAEASAPSEKSSATPPSSGAKAGADAADAEKATKPQ